MTKFKRNTLVHEENKADGSRYVEVRRISEPSDPKNVRAGMMVTYVQESRIKNHSGSLTVNEYIKSTLY